MNLQAINKSIMRIVITTFEDIEQGGDEIISREYTTPFVSQETMNQNLEDIILDSEMYLGEKDTEKFVSVNHSDKNADEKLSNLKFN